MLPYKRKGHRAISVDRERLSKPQMLPKAKSKQYCKSVEYDKTRFIWKTSAINTVWSREHSKVVLPITAAVFTVS